MHEGAYRSVQVHVDVGIMAIGQRRPADRDEDARRLRAVGQMVTIGDARSSGIRKGDGSRQRVNLGFRFDIMRHSGRLYMAWSAALELSSSSESDTISCA